MLREPAQGSSNYPYITPESYLSLVVATALVCGTTPSIRSQHGTTSTPFYFHNLYLFSPGGRGGNKIRSS